MILDVREVWYDETWDDESDGSRGYQRFFRVVSDDPDESPVALRTHPDIPPQNDPHPDDSAAYVTKRSGKRLDSTRLVHEVTVDYERKVVEPTDDPRERAAVIRWTGSLVQVAVFRDINDNAIVNSAGDYFDPPPEAERPRAIVNIQFNAAYVPIAILNYIGAVNNSALVIDGVPITTGRARVIGLDIGNIEEENDIQFRAITLAVECRDAADEPFDLNLIDQGFRIKVAGVQKDILIQDEDGNNARPSSPVLLNGSGAKVTNPAPGTAHYLPFEITRKLDFTVFPGIVAG